LINLPKIIDDAATDKWVKKVRHHAASGNLALFSNLGYRFFARAW
jgi:hypothetical protein